jgi:hypothetical protein
MVSTAYDSDETEDMAMSGGEDSDSDDGSDED